MSRAHDISQPKFGSTSGQGSKQLLGRSTYLSSAMTNAGRGVMLSTATGSSNDVLVLGDFERGYSVCGRVGVLSDTSRGWLVGEDCVLHRSMIATYSFSCSGLIVTVATNVMVSEFPYLSSGTLVPRLSARSMHKYSACGQCTPKTAHNARSGAVMRRCRGGRVGLGSRGWRASCARVRAARRHRSGASV